MIYYTRIKREVIAQMLDYASRASKWDIEDIKTSFKENNDVPNLDPKLDPDEKGEFWDKVSTNLAAEHFRLVFAADDIPDTLRILIEFLDRTMKNIEVYGVELKPYTTADGCMLIASNIIGNSTLDSLKVTSSGKRSVYTRSVEEFKAEFRERGLGEYISVFESIYEYGKKIGLSWESGSGAKHPAYLAKLGKQTIFRVVLLKSQGTEKALVEFYVRDISNLFKEEANIDTIRQRIINFHDKDALQKDELLGPPSTTQTIRLDALRNQENQDYLFDALKKLVEDISQEMSEE